MVGTNLFSAYVFLHLPVHMACSFGVIFITPYISSFKAAFTVTLGNLVNTVEPVLNGTVLSSHPLLNGHVAKSRKFYNVKLKTYLSDGTGNYRYSKMS